MLKFESSHLDYYKALLEKENIRCDFHITSAFDLCLNEKMAEIGQRSFKARQTDFPDDMKPFMEVTDPEHLERLSQVKGALWGCVYKVGSIHPYKLVNGLLLSCFRMAKSGGGELNLQTHTPVLNIEHASDGWTARTDRGNVTAPKVVVCCNGYTSNLLPQFANKIVPVRGPCSALAIPPRQPASTPSTRIMRPLFTTYSLKNDEHDFDYMISRQESPNHIVVGGGHEAFEHLPDQWYGNTDDSSQMQVVMPSELTSAPGQKNTFSTLCRGTLSITQRHNRAWTDYGPEVGPAVSIADTSHGSLFRWDPMGWPSVEPTAWFVYAWRLPRQRHGVSLL